MQRAKKIELFDRKVSLLDKNKRKNVYINGSDDNYPERVDLIINNSVTAKMAVNKMVSFVVGKGFKNKALNTKILNKNKDLTGFEILMLIANSLVRQKGVFLHSNINGKLENSSIDVLPYKFCRKEKGDDIDNKGKIYYSEAWNDTGFSFNKKNTNSRWFYPFTKNENVLKSQLKADDVTLDESTKTHNFRGHASFLNLEPENIYPLSFIDPAYNDADSEYHSSVHRNNTIRNGFTDKQLIVAKKSSNEGDELEDVIVDMLGSNGANIGLIEVGNEVEDISKEIHTINLGTEVKSERYEYFDKINQTKILQCFENIPEALVLGNDGSLIGDGGGKLKELKLNYSQDIGYIRTAIEQQLTKIFPNQDWEIEPMVKEDIVSTEEEKLIEEQKIKEDE